MKHAPGSEALSTVFFVVAIALVALAGVNQWEQRQDTRALMDAAADTACVPAYEARGEAGPDKSAAPQPIGLALTTIAYQSHLDEQAREAQNHKEPDNNEEPPTPGVSASTPGP